MHRYLYVCSLSGLDQTGGGGIIHISGSIGVRNLETWVKKSRKLFHGDAFLFVYAFHVLICESKGGLYVNIKLHFLLSEIFEKYYRMDKKIFVSA